MKNESGKHYFSLDSEEYTLYTDEQEILLQAGLPAKILSFDYEKNLIVFNLYVSEKMIRRRKQALRTSFIVPILTFFLNRLYANIYTVTDP